MRVLSLLFGRKLRLHSPYRKGPFLAASGVASVASISASVVIAAVFLLAAATPAYADRILPPLASGMGYHEVIARWGEPIERQEQETKRADVWTYQKGMRVFFSQGKVIAWSGAEKQDAMNLDSQSERSDALKPKNDARKSGSVDDLLSEILKDIPSLDDGPDGGSPGRPGAAPAPLSGVAVPPPVAIAPNPDA